MLEITEARFGTADFDACMAIRMTVFVDEQRVPADEERDAYDPTALHFLARLDGTPAGTARVIFPAGPDPAKITRVAVLAPYRGCGIGAVLMRHILTTIGARHVTLDAQVHAQRFYERLGFAPQSGIFMEAGIPHLTMGKNT
jgi:predicted GNAT family N-acyltransferase